MIRSRGSSVTIVIRLRAGRSGFNSRPGQGFFSYLARPYGFWVPPSPLLNWNRGLFPRE